MHPQLSQLGPDLLGDDCEMAQVLRRLRAPAHAAREIADALLDQRIAAGIGNVYKSEVCFLEGVHPFARVADLDDETVRALYQSARAWLQRNLGPWTRTTTVDRSAGQRPAAGQPLVWVYGRAGKPCLRCGAPIEQRRQGDLARPTYWCGGCQ